MLADLGNSQPIHNTKNVKACSGENTKVETGQSFAKRLGV